MGACCDKGRPEISQDTEEARKSEKGQDGQPLGEPQQAAAAAAAAATPCSFRLQLHSASLSRSFASFGWMDPYAVLTVDGKEVGRTPPDKWAHKEPKWNSSYSWQAEGVPGTVKIAIWDKNNFHKDVLCGQVTVPCDVEMGKVEGDFTLTKKNKPSGVVRLTLRVPDTFTPRDDEGAVTRQPTLGGEMDQVIDWARGSEATKDRTLSLQEDEDAGGEDDSYTGEAKVQPIPSGLGGSITPALIGSWKCVDTFGLDEFLQATGVDMFRRKIAKAAKWPSWDYFAENNQLIFINNSAIGKLREEIPLGKEYQWKDGHGNPMTCKAVWEKSSNGGTLTTTREGDKTGKYVEERRVTDNKLEFRLTREGLSWGRVFERELA